MTTTKESFEVLSYIDKEYESLTDIVDDMIQEEMMTYPPREYLDHLPEPPVLFKKEMERVAKKQPLEGIDMTRYEVKPPAINRKKNPDAWNDSLQNAQSQIEHQHNRYQTELQELQKRKEEVNRNRKLTQTNAQPEFARLQYSWYELMYKNATIEHVCAQMERDIAAIEESLKEAGEDHLINKAIEENNAEEDNKMDTD